MAQINENIVNLENYYFPGDLINRLEEFVEYYNNERDHESLKNLTPAGVYFGHEREILKQRHLIKLKTMKKEESNTCRHD